jgi:hypothetical protein
VQHSKTGRPGSESGSKPAHPAGSDRQHVRLTLKAAEKIERAIRTTPSAKERPGLRRIAAELGVGVGTAQRVSREAALTERPLSEITADRCTMSA